MTNKFTKSIQPIRFKTIFQNRPVEFGFDELFFNRRVLVLSTTRLVSSYLHVSQFANQYSRLQSSGIDDVYVINSSEWLVGPWVAKHFPVIKGLPDRGAAFAQALAEHYSVNIDPLVVATQWQYMIIIKNGVPEKLWHNPVKNNTPLRVLQNESYNYYKLGVDKVLDHTGLW